MVDLTHDSELMLIKRPAAKRKTKAQGDAAIKAFAATKWRPVPFDADAISAKRMELLGFNLRIAQGLLSQSKDVMMAKCEKVGLEAVDVLYGTLLSAAEDLKGLAMIAEIAMDRLLSAESELYLSAKNGTSQKRTRALKAS